MRKLSLKITHSAKTLSSFSGLHLFDDLFHKFEIQQLITPYLPIKRRHRGLSSFEKLFAGILGFVVGAECLDDFDWLGNDPLFRELTNSPSSITIGKFLRLFSLRQIQQIQNLLPTLALKMRLWLEPNLYKIVFKMDSSDHEQYGVQMEGVDFGYRKVRCLNSQNLFDDKGLCYGFDLRKGNTYSGKGAVEMMEAAFRVVPKSIQKFFVADSAYGSLTIYNCLLNHNVNFAICLKENVWEPQLEKCRNKITWHKAKLHFFGSDKCEIGSAIYSLKGLVKGRTFLRVVFIRTKKKEIKSGDSHPYHYYAIVTNMSESEMTNEQIIKFYRRRSQVENNIKDLKQGMDFYHFPCQSLKANNVWGLMGIIAYNMMRMVSFTISKDGCFVQTTRRKIVLLASEVVKHARSIEIRMMDYVAKEVTRLKMILCRLSFLDREDRLIPLRP